MTRVFLPDFVYVPGTSILTRVKQWVKRAGHPLQVVYCDGFTCKSDYKTIKELMHHERVIEWKP